MASQRPLPFVQRRTYRGGGVGFRGYVDLGNGLRRYTKTYPTQQEAYDKALELRGIAKTRPRARTLFDATEDLLDELRVKRTAGTVRWYSDHLRAVKALIDGDTYLHDITPLQLEQFVRDRLASKRKVSPATVNADLRALHRVFAVGIRHGYCDSNPVQQVDRPRADAPAMDWFTEGELSETIARIPDEHTRDVLLLFALTGLRRSEAARLQPGHVRLRLRQIVVPGKTATRVVPISTDLDQPLARLLARAKAQLLPGGTHAIDDLFRAARKACEDRRLHPHALRHTFGTALVRQGTRPDVVMRLMGHRSLTTTLRYVHEVGEDGIAAVQGLRIVRPSRSGQAGPS